MYSELAQLSEPPTRGYFLVEHFLELEHSGLSCLCSSLFALGSGCCRRQIYVAGAAAVNAICPISQRLESNTKAESQGYERPSQCPVEAAVAAEGVRHMYVEGDFACNLLNLAHYNGFINFRLSIADF